MGLVSWFKWKFNIGGLKIKILEVQPITKEEGWAKGKVTFSTGTPIGAKVTYKLLCETTKGKGDEKETSTSIVSQQTFLTAVIMPEPGSETKDFTFQYDFKEWSEKQGGVLATAGKVMDFIQDPFGGQGSAEYFVEAPAGIPGAWATPSDRVPVQVNIAE
jgi:hypothetical protein